MRPVFARRRDPRVDQLAPMPLFAGASQRELAALSRLLDEVDLPADTELFRQGELGREFALVVDGRLQVRRDDRTVALLGPGDVVGEMSLLGAVRRNASVVTLTPTRLLVGTPAVLDAVRQASDDVAARFDRLVEDRRAA